MTSLGSLSPCNNWHQNQILFLSLKIHCKQLSLEQNEIIQGYTTNQTYKNMNVPLQDYGIVTKCFSNQGSQRNMKVNMRPKPY